MQKQITSFILGLLLVLFGWNALQHFFKTNDDETDTASVSAREVQVLTLRDSGEELTPLTLTGTIVSAADVAITAEASGKIQSINIDVDQKVSKGQVLLTLENSDQQIAVSRAQSALAAQQAALDDLLEEANKQSGSTVGAVEEQIKTTKKNAYTNFINTDLRAYSVGNRFNNGERVEEIPSPVVTGTYGGGTEGVYTIQFYGSGAESGVSARVTGLEISTFPASVIQPSSLGTQGLFIQLPAAVDPGDYKDTIWEVPIPNTRSSGYQSAKAAYESTLAGSDVTISQTEVSPRQIEQMERAVEQAKLSLSSAQVALGRTIIRAPIAGTITNFDLDQGDFVGAGSPVAVIKNLDDLEGQVFITEQDRRFVQVGNYAIADNLVEGSVSRIATIVDQSTQKVEVRLAANLENDDKYKDEYTEGQSVSIELSRSLPAGSKRADLYNNQFLVPLTAVQIIGTTPNIFTVENNTAVAVPIVTGLLLGDQVVVTDGLSDIDTVIIDSRGLTEGDAIVTLN
jgi:RND family efflux transporter MFP subunit